MNSTYFSASQSVFLPRQAVAGFGRALLVTTLSAALIACAPARKDAYPTPLFESVVADQAPSLVIKKDIDLVRLEGALGSQEDFNLIAQSASDLFGPELIINSLVVDETLGDVDWLDSVLQTLNAIQDVEDFSLVAGSGHLVVGGTVDTYDQAEEIASTASDLAGLTLAVSSAIAYPEVLVAENTVSEPLVPDEGVPVSLVSLAVLEQQAVAVAIEQPAALPVAAVAVAPEKSDALEIARPVEELPVAIPVDEQVVPEDVVVIPASINDQLVDTDRDGIPDLDDECASRPGYPVNKRGCQLLDGNLKDVHFHGATDQLTEDAMLSLNNIVEIMGEHPKSKIAVLSYSQDGLPSEMRVQARDRAYSVVDYLVGQGIDPARLQAFALSHRQGISEQILIKEVE